ISPNDAKDLWQKGQEKRLFFKVTGFNNEKHYLSGQGVLVELGQRWFSDKRVWLIDETLLGLSPTNKGKHGVKVMMDIPEPVSVFVLALEFLSAWWWLIIVVIVVILLIGFEWKQRGRDQSLFLFNPLDHLRLLWWSLVMPQHLKAYKADHDIERIGKWLVSTLIWLPLLMPTLGLGFELLPHSNTALSANVYLIMCAGLGICWLLTGWLGDNDENLVVVLAVGLAVLLAVGLAVSLAGGLAVVLAVLLAGGLAVGQACGLAFGLAVSLAFGLAGGLASGLAGIVLAGVLAGVLVFGLAGGLVVIMEESLRTGTPSWIARFTFLLLIAAHLFLIYYCFLGGWRLFV
ncbi:MAG: hypothetical protein KAH77_08430, partial [Thiomargarita sp.]|nr:hypothetical protein [Thiomargarita sp.]